MIRRSARAIVRVLAVFVALLVTSPAAFAQTIPPAPTAWVTDAANLLSVETAGDLNAELRAYERRTGHQILVYIAPTTGGVPIDDWAVNAFAKWKVGRAGLDDGLVLFIFPQDRTARIEVGYGLEPYVPDARAAEILRNTVEPGIRAQEADDAITSAVAQLIALAGEGPGTPSAPAPLTPIDLVAIGILALIVLAIAVRSPWLVLYLLVNIAGGRGGGFSGGGGGGFSGGGGRSGGGGASGRW